VLKTFSGDFRAKKRQKTRFSNLLIINKLKIRRFSAKPFSTENLFDFN